MLIRIILDHSGEGSLGPVIERAVLLVRLTAVLRQGRKYRVHHFSKFAVRLPVARVRVLGNLALRIDCEDPRLRNSDVKVSLLVRISIPKAAVERIVRIWEEPTDVPKRRNFELVRSPLNHLTAQSVEEPVRAEDDGPPGAIDPTPPPRRCLMRPASVPANSSS